MMRRATPSTSSHGVPTAAASTAAAWAACRTRVQVAELGRRLAGEDGAGDVGAVAVEHAAEVADHGLAGLR